MTIELRKDIFRIVPVAFPVGGIVLDIFADAVQFGVISDNMVKIISLPAKIIIIFIAPFSDANFKSADGRGQ